MVEHPEDQTGTIIFKITKLYQWGLLFMGALLPTFGMLYLYLFQNPPLRFFSIEFHEIAIATSILASGFIALVTWRCYLLSGEPLLRWITLGLVSFTIVYTPHGVFTVFAFDNIWFFLLYGPPSRLLMSGCLLMGLIKYNQPADPLEERKQVRFWWKAIGGLLLLDVAIGILAFSPIASHPATRMSIEITALAFSVIAIVIILLKKIRSPLMMVYALAFACFAQSSLAFLPALAWTHAWWYAHFIFLVGFFLLSYGIVKAFHTTHSFSGVYSQEEMMMNLRLEKSKTEETLQQLKRVDKMRQGLITDLQEALKNIKQLSGLLPICANCKKIRDDEGYWKQIEGYIESRSEAQFSHGICEECAEVLYKDTKWYQKRMKDKEKE